MKQLKKLKQELKKQKTMYLFFLIYQLNTWKNNVDTEINEEENSITESHTQFQNVLKTVQGELSTLTQDLLKQFTEKRNQFQGKLDEQKDTIQKQITEFQNTVTAQVDEFQAQEKQSLNEVMNQRVDVSNKAREVLDQFNSNCKGEIRKIYYEANNYFSVVNNGFEERRSLMTAHQTVLFFIIQDTTNTNTEVTNQIVSMKDRTNKYIEDNSNLRKTAHTIQDVIVDCAKELKAWSLLKTVSYIYLIVS